MTISNLAIGAPVMVTPAIQAAARQMRPDFRKDLARGVMGDLLTAYAGLAAAFDAVDLEEVLFSHTRWELSLLQADGPAILCRTCWEKIARDVVLDEDLQVVLAEHERIIAAMKTHHVRAVRAAFCGGVAR